MFSETAFITRRKVIMKKNTYINELEKFAGTVGYTARLGLQQARGEITHISDPQRWYRNMPVYH